MNRLHYKAAAVKSKLAYFSEEFVMSIQTSYAQASERLNDYLDEATHNREIVIIQRPGEEDVALIAADELAGLLETAHLLRSPANAERLMTALNRVRRGEGTPLSLDELKQESGL